MNKLLQKAIDNLQIADVYLVKLDAHKDKKFHHNFNPLSTGATISYMHDVSETAVLDISDDSGNDLQILQVFIDFGLRWSHPEDEEGHEGALIEAQFVAEYILKDEIDADCINEFALKNASYHVWPYWRELATNQCLRMNIPKVIIPAMQLQHHTLKSDDESEE